MIRVDPNLFVSLRKDKNFNAQACFHCGTCTALCPVGLEILPRELFRFVLLGAQEEITKATDTIFSCLLCGLCEAHCPRGVKIAQNIRTLRSYLVRHEYRIH